jgi:hypothetical protein
MPRTVPRTDSITREEAIDRLRQKLVTLTSSDACMCKMAGDLNVGCRGFRRFSDKELRDRYWWIVRKRPNVSRSELETLANDWQLTQQEVKDLPIACDVQASVQDTCRGWFDFTNEQLAGFLEEVSGEKVRIV